MPDPLSLALDVPAGPVRLGEPVPLRVTITNVSDAPVRMVGVVDGAEGGQRYPRYLPVVALGPTVVARPGPADPLVGPLRASDIVVLAPGGSFDPTARTGSAAYLPLSTFSTFRPDTPGRYRFELTVDTRSPDPTVWLGRFNQDAERDAVLDIVGAIPALLLAAALDVDVGGCSQSASAGFDVCLDCAAHVGEGGPSIMAAAGSILGNAVLRLEDPTLLTGEGKFVDDLVEVGTLHVAFARSSVAHAKVLSIDVSEAASMPGVVAVYHAGGDDLGLAPVQQFPMMPESLNRPVFAGETVRFVGDIVAAVVAESRDQAADAAERVVVDYQPLPSVINPLDALAPDAPLLFPEHGSNVCFATAHPAEGNDDPLVGADTVAEVTMVSQRLAGVPMENNGILAVPTDGGLTCWVSHQAPHSIHAGYAPALGLEPGQLRIVCPWVGGGFGPKAAPYIEHIVAAAAAMKLDRPVKWVETRSEDMVSLVHGRDFVMTAKLGVSADGKIVGFDGSVVAAAGAYPGIGAILPMLTQMMSVGVYSVPQVRFKGTTVLTNNTTIGAYRGAGRPEATQLIERVLDVAADMIDLDPAEMRRRNFLQPGQFPLTTPTGAEYDSGEYERSLDAALAASGYQDLRAEQARRRASGDTKQLGIGLSTYVEITAPVGLHIEFGAVEINDDGSANVYAGTSVHGQGHHTAFAMLASEVLGIPMEKITLVNSDTDRVPRGAGTMGSRSLQTAGNAIHAASNEVLDRARKIAGQLLEAPADDIVAGDGGVHVAGVPSKAVSWADLAVASRDASKLPEGLEPAPLRHELDFDGSGSTFPFGAHVSVVEVDTETGQVTMLRHVAVDDCGRILNPLLVAGQQHGGIAQGAAQALFEWMQYDEDGNPVTSTLADYAIPSAAELCSFEVSNTQTDSPRNPLGAKGIGESGTIGSTPAIQNAVVDAVSHLGIRHIDMPCTAETVWQAIQTASK